MATVQNNSVGVDRPSSNKNTATTDTVQHQQLEHQPVKSNNLRIVVQCSQSQESIDPQRK
eukprot:4119542-Amphidinium_carterae.2